MRSINKSTLDKITNKIVQNINPAMIFLFGSYAVGKQNEHSDLDIMCVEERPFGQDRSRRKEVAKIARLLSEFEIPMDILVYSRDEIKKWTDSKNHIISQIMKEGKLLHERQ